MCSVYPVSRITHLNDTRINSLGSVNEAFSSPSFPVWNYTFLQFWNQHAREDFNSIRTNRIVTTNSRRPPLFSWSREPNRSYSQIAPGAISLKFHFDEKQPKPGPRIFFWTFGSPLFRNSKRGAPNSVNTHPIFVSNTHKRRSLPVQKLERLQLDNQHAESSYGPCDFACSGLFFHGPKL